MDDDGLVQSELMPCPKCKEGKMHWNDDLGAMVCDKCGHIIDPEAEAEMEAERQAEREYERSRGFY